MSATSVETSLFSLLPILNGNLPSEVVHLATSLLAQSRMRINLKPNEEIARPYACAEIACKRLQSRLKLPSTHGRPPLPPKVYAKLLDLLEKGLQVKRPAKATASGAKDTAGFNTSTAKGLRTPTKRGVGDPEVESRSAVSTPGRTPNKKITFAGRFSARKIPRTGDVTEAPEWIMPFIRRLSATFTTPMLPPHVYTGACMVLKLSGLWPESESSQEEEFRNTATAMTLAIYFMVWTKMQLGKITTDEYLSRCEKALEVAGDTDCGDLNKAAVDNWIKKMNDHGWCRGQDWWDSVPEDVMEVVENGDVEDNIAEEDDLEGLKLKRKRRRLMADEQAEDDKEGVLLLGLGTMMQEAVDFLSEDRTLDYLEWKEGILERIKQMEKGKVRAVSIR